MRPTVSTPLILRSTATGTYHAGLTRPGYHAVFTITDLGANGTCCYASHTASATPSHTPFKQNRQLVDQADPRGLLYSLVPAGGWPYEAGLLLASDQVSSLFAPTPLSVQYDACMHAMCTSVHGQGAAPVLAVGGVVGIFATSSTTISIDDEDMTPSSTPLSPEPSVNLPTSTARRPASISIVDSGSVAPSTESSGTIKSTTSSGISGTAGRTSDRPDSSTQTALSVDSTKSDSTTTITLHRTSTRTSYITVKTTIPNVASAESLSTPSSLVQSMVLGQTAHNNLDSGGPAMNSRTAATGRTMTQAPVAAVGSSSQLASSSQYQSSLHVTAHAPHSSAKDEVAASLAEQSLSTTVILPSATDAESLAVSANVPSASAWTGRIQATSITPESHSSTLASVAEETRVIPLSTTAVLVEIPSDSADAQSQVSSQGTTPTTPTPSDATEGNTAVSLMTSSSMNVLATTQSSLNDSSFVNATARGTTSSLLQDTASGGFNDRGSSGSSSGAAVVATSSIETIGISLATANRLCTRDLYTALIRIGLLSA